MRRLAHIAALVLGIAPLFGVNMYMVSRSEAPVDAAPVVRMTDLAMYYDKTGNQPPWVVTTMPFVPVASHTSYGYLSGKFWFRFRLSSDAKADPGNALVRVDIPNLDEVTLNYRDKEGQWRQTVTGDSLPLTARPWTSPRLGFVVNLADLAGQQAYISVRSSGTLGIGISAGSVTSMLVTEGRDQLLDIGYIALILMAIAATAVLYVLGRDRVFLLFFGSQLIYFCAVLSYTGYLSVLAPNLASDRITSFWTPLAMLATITFHVCFFRAIEVNKLVSYAGWGILFALAVLLASRAFFDVSVLPNVWYLGNLFLILLVVAGWTVREPAYMSKRAIRMIYTTYAIASAVWMLPTAGLLSAPRSAFFGPGIQGVLNITLIFAMVFRFSSNQKRQAENARRDMERLRVDGEIQQRTSKIYRDLLWMISHEVGTSLTVLRLGLSKPEISAQNKERMQRALLGLEGLMTSFSRSELLELGEVTVNICPVDLVELVKGVADLEDVNRAKPRLRFVHRGNAVAETDEVYMRTVVSNLLTNAIKYSPDQTPIDLTLTVEQARVVLQVENQCLPQAIPDIDRVFDRFYRDAHVLDKPGTGLGLTIVKQLMRLLGGECSFEIRDADRVRVTIWFPIQN